MSKRAAGEGSVYQRKDGRWTASLTIEWTQGKQKRKSFYGSTQREVLDKLNAARAAHDKGIELVPERLTLVAWLTKWLADQVPPAKKPKTYTNYEYHIREHLAPDLGHIPLSKLQPQHVRDFMRQKLSSGLSPKTVRHLRATLRAALGVAVADGLLARNAASLAKPPRLEKRIIAPLTREQSRAFLAKATLDRLEAVFTVALCLAMREGEILGLQWNDIDFENRHLFVRRAIQRAKLPGETKSHMIVVTPKTSSSVRQINLPNFAITALAAHKLRQDEERVFAGSDWIENGLVFTTRIGTPLDQKMLDRALRRMLRAAALPRMRFHDLRHSAVALLIEQGVHPRVIMELLGHSSITPTMNTYGHLFKDVQREAADKMDAIFEMGDGKSDGMRQQLRRN